MKIVDVEAIPLRLPKVLPIGDGTQDCLVVKVYTDEGIVGIGEAHTSPYVLKQVIDAPMSHVSAIGLKEVILGEDPTNIEYLWEKMYAKSRVFGRRGAAIHALSAIDIALWDILGKALNQPVYKLLGGSFRQEIPAYASDLAYETAEESVEAVLRYQADGFRAAKFGWGPLGQSVKSDLKQVRQLRQAVGDDFDIMVDLGMPVEYSYALALGRGLEEQGVYFLEEPLSPDDLQGYRALSDALDMRVACGEKEQTRWEFRALMETAGVDVVQPDIARVGGLTEARRIATLAGMYGKTVIPHCWSSDILVAASLHFIATLPYCPYFEYCVLDGPLRREVCTETIPCVDGMVKIPQGPGLGIELNEDTLQRYRYNG